LLLGQKAGPLGPRLTKATAQTTLVCWQVACSLLAISVASAALRCKILCEASALSGPGWNMHVGAASMFRLVGCYVEMPRVLDTVSDRAVFLIILQVASGLAIRALRVGYAPTGSSRSAICAASSLANAAAGWCFHYHRESRRFVSAMRPQAVPPQPLRSVLASECRCWVVFSLPP
jgi:hypothetical protein